jgi:hypothetical protein
MYIRWQTRRHRAIILVENVRVDGRRRQKHVAYLAGFDERQIDGRPQCGLWERITRKLDALGDRLTPEDRRRIEREIAAEIPCPTTQQYDCWRREGETGWLAKYMDPRVPRWPKP